MMSQITEQDRLVLLNALKAVRDDDAYRTSDIGICTNVSFYIRMIYPYVNHTKLKQAVKDLYSLWPNYSGHERFPVSVTDELTPMEQYNGPLSVWDKSNPYGRARWELLHWMIDQLGSMKCDTQE